MSGLVNEAYALRYTGRPDCLPSEAYYRHDLYGEPDAAIGMDYFFWLLRTEDNKNVVIDCGFGEQTGAERHRFFQTPPRELLARMGTDPAAVDHVVLTHMHFDHVGNTDLFPNATFHMGRAEHDFWFGPHRDVPALNWAAAPEDLAAVELLLKEERLRLIEDTGEVIPGIDASVFSGHTPGQLVTEVAVGDTRLVLTSDALHYYDEMDLDRPFYVYSGMTDILDSYARLRDLEAQPDVVIVPGHDPAVTTEYAEVEKNCLDLTRRIHDAPRRRKTGSPTS